MPTDLSPRQQTILNYLKEFISERDYPPSIRDIQGACSISSTSVVDYNLKRLEEKGYIRRTRETARSIELLGGGARGVLTVYFVGGLRADAPLDPTRVEEYTTVPKRMHFGHEFDDDVAAARVLGSGFTESLLANNDVLLLDFRVPDPNGLLVVWSDTLYETLVGHIRRYRGVDHLERGPLAPPLTLGKWEPVANVVAVFRNYID